MATTFEVTPGWLRYHPNPSKPTFQVPPGSVDAHCHVFGAGDLFPYALECKYTPCDAPKEKLEVLRRATGEGAPVEDLDVVPPSLDDLYAHFLRSEEEAR